MNALGLLLLLALPSCVRDQEEVAIRFSRPSRLVLKFVGLLDSDSGVQPDDLKGVILVTGTEESIARIKKFIAMFDVKRHTVSIKWKLTHDVEKTEYQGTATLPNNVGFTFSDDETRARVTLTSRLTAEQGEAGLATVVRVEIDGALFQKNVFSKSGAQFMVKISEMTPQNDRARKALESLDPREWPRLAFTFSVAERQPQTGPAFKEAHSSLRPRPWTGRGKAVPGVADHP